MNTENEYNIQNTNYECEYKIPIQNTKKVKYLEVERIQNTNTNTKYKIQNTKKPKYLGVERRLARFNS